MRLHALLAAATAALALAACSNDPSTVVTKADPAGPHDVVFSVAQEGGFVRPEAIFDRVPEAAVYGDGTALSPGAAIQIYPGPAYVALRVGRLTDRQVARLADLAESEGLIGAPVDAGQPPVADVPDTVVTIRTPSGRIVTHRANALGMDAGSESLSANQRDARARLGRFVDALSSAAGTAASGAYAPDGFRVRATAADPQQATGGGEPQPRVRPWPVTGVDLAAADDCLAVTGADATRVADTMDQADQLTFFTTATATYQVTIRPLLPDEDGCPAATG